LKFCLASIILLFYLLPSQYIPVNISIDIDGLPFSFFDQDAFKKAVTLFSLFFYKVDERLRHNFQVLVMLKTESGCKFDTFVSGVGMDVTVLGVALYRENRMDGKDYGGTMLKNPFWQMFA
jgi:hypothetical protein